MLAESKFRSKFKSKFTSRFDRGLLMAGTVMASSSRLPHWVTLGASADFDFTGERYSVEGLAPDFTDIPGATVSGGVNGTVVRDGVIVAATEQNLLTYSEDFTNAAWLKLNSASVTGNQAAAPDGQMTADLIDLSNTSGSTSNGSRVFQSNLSLTDGVAYTFSFWARSVSGSGTFPYAWWHGTNYVKSYASLTEEWQRFSVTFTAPTGVTNDIVGFTRRGDTHTETLDQAYIWGAQLREARYSDTYVPTTSAAITRAAPRIGDDGLLVEGAATNLLTSSGYLFGAGWSGTATEGVADATAPDGSEVFESTPINGVSQRLQTVTLSTSTTYTLSLWLKRTNAGTGFTNITLRDETAGSFLFQQPITWTDAGVASAGTGTNVTAVSIEEFPASWYRISVTGDTGVNASCAVRLYPDAQAGTAATYIWGAQLETGSTATSYIPTEGSSVTRTADSVTLTDLDALGLTSAVLGELDVPLDDDFTGYADQAAAEAAGYTFGTDWSFDAANDQLDKAAGVSNSNISKTIGLTSGDTFVLEITTSNRTAGSLAIFVQGTYVGVNVTTDGTRTFTVEAGSANSLLEITGTSDFDGSIDSITIRRAEPLGGYTVVVEGESELFGNSKFARILEIGDGTANDRVTVLHTSSNQINAFQVSGGTNQASLTVANATSPSKIAIRCAPNNYGMSVNGSAVVGDTSANAVSADQIVLGGWYAGTQPLSGSIPRLTIIPRAVSDAELQALSS